MKYYIYRSFVKECESANFDWRNEIKRIHGPEVEIIILEK